MNDWRLNFSRRLQKVWAELGADVLPYWFTIDPMTARSIAQSMIIKHMARREKEIAAGDKLLKEALDERD